MFKWTDLDAQQQHVNALQREAELERRARQYLPEQPRRRLNLIKRIEAGLGSQLIRLGCYFQERAQPALHIVSQPGPKIDSNCRC